MKAKIAKQSHFGRSSAVSQLAEVYNAARGTEISGDPRVGGSQDARVIAESLLLSKKEQKWLPKIIPRKHLKHVKKNSQKI